MSKRLNLTILLKHLDLRNLEVYTAVSSNQEDRKEFDRMLSYILPLWMSGATNPKDQIQITLNFNRHVNEDWWGLEGHPELRAKLLAAIGLGRGVKHDYQARRSRRSNVLTEFLTQRYPDIRADEVQVWCLRNSEAALVDLCAQYGVQEKEREIIIAEYRDTLS